MDDEGQVFWHGRWYPQPRENDGTIAIASPDARPLHTTTLPHFLLNLDGHFPCASACAAVSETGANQTDYMEELGWRHGIETLNNEVNKNGEDSVSSGTVPGR